MRKLWKEKERFEKRAHSFRAKFLRYEALLESMDSSEVIDDAHDYSGLVGATAVEYWKKRQRQYSRLSKIVKRKAIENNSTSYEPMYNIFY